MDIQPMTRNTELAEPCPVLADGIQKDADEERNAHEPQIEADGPTRPKQMVLRRERAVNRRQLVVIETINKDGKVGCNSKGVQRIEAQTMASVGIVHGLGAVSYSNCGGSAHFWATFSSVLTENFL